MPLEGDWPIARGNDETRWSLVYELTPVQFLQLRAGVRDYYGPAAIPSERTRLVFVQLHGFL